MLLVYWSFWWVQFGGAGASYGRSDFVWTLILCRCPAMSPIRGWGGNSLLYDAFWGEIFYMMRSGVKSEREGSDNLDRTGETPLGVGVGGVWMEIPDAIALTVTLVSLTVVFVTLRRAYKRNLPRQDDEAC